VKADIDARRGKRRKVNVDIVFAFNNQEEVIRLSAITRRLDGGGVLGLNDPPATCKLPRLSTT
jgi:hypothetical protein